MSNDGFWVDVADLKTIGRAHLADLGDQLGGSADRLGDLTIASDVFGLPGEGPDIVAGYHVVLAQLQDALAQTSAQVHRVGAAVADVARNYESMDNAQV